VKSEGYDKPDLVVLFNSGWVDGDDAESHWRPTIEWLLESDIPVLFTTYNAQEALNEEVQMRKLGARFLVEPGENKWKGLVATPEFLDKEYDFWWQNSHLYVVKGRSHS
jgi:splicing suppressor protein 51